MFEITKFVFSMSKLLFRKHYFHDLNHNINVFWSTQSVCSNTKLELWDTRLPYWDTDSVIQDLYDTPRYLTRRAINKGPTGSNKGRTQRTPPTHTHTLPSAAPPDPPLWGQGPGTRGQTMGPGIMDLARDRAENVVISSAKTLRTF